MKNIFLLMLIAIIGQESVAQQNYCDFEGIKAVSFGIATGIMDSMVSNPAPNTIDTSAHCAKYIRSTVLYDNFKLYPHLRLADIISYTGNDSLTPKITMKLFTTAPAGTPIEVQLGSKSDDNYPSGFHSEYRAITTVSNAWEDITFDFTQLTPGGLVTTTDIDKILILFHPNSTNSEIFYFDDPSGPPLIPSGVSPVDQATFKLYQNYPNPAPEITYINFQLNSPGMVSLKLFNCLGEPVLSILDKNMKAGVHAMPIETVNIPDGMYFYVLKKDGVSRTKKLIVAK